ncbi:hypothetical protein RZS08_30295, partial [Arthrospira platensis SPKY1]|nr:hypothetical protein [Arthrospira platensis SPKY1]
EDLMLKFKLKEFAHSLEEGSPCPVCGSLEHPQPIQIGNIEIMLKETEARIKNGETVIKNIGNITDKFRELSYEFSSENKIKGDISKSIAEKEKELQDHIETFNWKEYSYEDRKIIAEKINL